MYDSGSYVENCHTQTFWCFQKYATMLRCHMFDCTNCSGRQQKQWEQSNLWHHSIVCILPRDTNIKISWDFGVFRGDKIRMSYPWEIYIGGN